jgi:putative ABC transport system permease protein
MKSYLDLVPLSQKVHKNQSRMVRLCIILSVFLVTAIFGMADMEIRSQKAQAQINYGKWHAGLRDISDEEMALISLRPKVLAATTPSTTGSACIIRSTAMRRFSSALTKMPWIFFLRLK